MEGRNWDMQPAAWEGISEREARLLSLALTLAVDDDGGGLVGESVDEEIEEDGDEEDKGPEMELRSLEAAFRLAAARL